MLSCANRKRTRSGLSFVEPMLADVTNSGKDMGSLGGHVSYKSSARVAAFCSHQWLEHYEYQK